MLQYRHCTMPFSQIYKQRLTKKSISPAVAAVGCFLVSASDQNNRHDYGNDLICDRVLHVATEASVTLPVTKWVKTASTTPAYT